MRSQQNVAKTGGGAALSEGLPGRLWVSKFEGVRQGILRGRMAKNRRLNAGIQVNPDERHDKTNVPAIRQAIVRQQRHRVRRGLHEQRRLNLIAFEGGIETRAVGLLNGPTAATHHRRRLLLHRWPCSILREAR